MTLQPFTRQTLSSTPVQTGNLLSALRDMIKWMIDEDHLEEDDDPTIGLRSRRTRASRDTCGWRPWNEDMARYRARWPLGSEARLMLDILACTIPSSPRACVRRAQPGTSARTVFAGKLVGSRNGRVEPMSKKSWDEQSSRSTPSWRISASPRRAARGCARPGPRPQRRRIAPSRRCSANATATPISHLRQKAQ